MDKIILITGAIGIGYLIYNQPIEEKKKVLDAVPDKITIQPTIQPTVEITKIGLLPPPVKEALLMNLKNTKPVENSKLFVIPIVILGISYTFYITVKALGIFYMTYNINHYNLTRETNLITNKDVIIPDFLNYYKNYKDFKKKHELDLDYTLKNMEFDIENKLKPFDNEYSDTNELANTTINFGDIKTGTTFIKPPSEIELETNITEDQSMLNAQIDPIDNIHIAIVIDKEKSLKTLKSLIIAIARDLRYSNSELSVILNKLHTKLVDDMQMEKYKEEDYVENIVSDLKQIIEKYPDEKNEKLIKLYQYLIKPKIETEIETEPESEIKTETEIELEKLKLELNNI